MPERPPVRIEMPAPPRDAEKHNIEEEEEAIEPPTVQMSAEEMRIMREQRSNRSQDSDPVPTAGSPARIATVEGGHTAIDAIANGANNRDRRKQSRTPKLQSEVSVQHREKTPLEQMIARQEAVSKRIAKLIKNGEDPEALLKDAEDEIHELDQQIRLIEKAQGQLNTLYPQLEYLQTRLRSMLAIKETEQNKNQRNEAIATVRESINRFNAKISELETETGEATVRDHYSKRSEHITARTILKHFLTQQNRP